MSDTATQPHVEEPTAQAVEGLVAPASTPPADPLPADRFLDRELSWLAFNERVLELAEDTDLPLLERAKFLAIFASNLDEFFMVRVAGLKRRIATGIAVRAASGLMPRELLERILSRTAPADAPARRPASATRCCPALRDAGIQLLRWDELTDDERARAAADVRRAGLPGADPAGRRPRAPVPLHLRAVAQPRRRRAQPEHRHRALRPRQGAADPAALRAGRPGSGSSRSRTSSPRTSTTCSRAWRSCSTTPSGSPATRTSRSRRTTPRTCSRPSSASSSAAGSARRCASRSSDSIDPHVLDLLVRELGVTRAGGLRAPRAARPDRRCGRSTASTAPTSSRPRSCPRPARSSPRSRPPRRRTSSRRCATATCCCTTPTTRSPPACSASSSRPPPTRRCWRSSRRCTAPSATPRSSTPSIDAAEAGKQVLALVEIKARFDEQANIKWARKLEQAGVPRGLRPRRAQDALQAVAWWCATRATAAPLLHIGTGNYHPKTARLYEDLGLLTADPAVGEDVADAVQRALRLLAEHRLQAPAGGPALDAHRPGRADRARGRPPPRGPPGADPVQVQLASSTRRIIDALYRASQAGVPVDVWVRGICALRPGVPGLSREHPGALSILGRFLEHSPRLLVRATAATRRCWIGCADLMHRNLDRRVEVLVRLGAEHSAQVADLFDIGLRPTRTTAWIEPASTALDAARTDADGEPCRDLQEHLIEAAAARPARTPEG